MEVVVRGSPKEIAVFVTELQKRHIDLSDNETNLVPLPAWLQEAYLKNKR